ncbi:MAG: GldG family protein [Candidatus Sumerlaeaceae bacterium]|nr:GldG family protein [Candidatus Sumerlaeaceae bacterium]
MRPLRLLSYLGLLMLLSGLVATGLHGRFTAVTAPVCIVGLLLALLFFAPQTTRNLKLYSYFGAYSTLVIGTLVLLFLILERHGWQYDATRNKRYSLTPITLNFLKRLPQPVHITAFVAETEKDQARLLLEQYAAASPKVSYTIANPFREAMLARRYGLQVMPGDIFIEAVTSSTQANTRVTRVNRISEQDITNGIVQVLRDRDIVLYFLIGHDELPLERSTALATLAGQKVSLRDLAWVRDQLERMGMRVVPLSLAQRGRVPSDASAVVWVGPRSDLSGLEAQLLRQYLEEGGRVLLLLPPDLPQTTGEISSVFRNVGELLGRFGIILPNELVVRVGAGQPSMDHFSVPAIFLPHPITDISLEEPLFFTYARPVQPASLLPSDMRVDTIVQSPGDCVRLSSAEVATAIVRRQDLSKAFSPQEIGAVPLGVAALRVDPNKPEEKAARLVVFGNSDFVSSERINQKGWLLFSNAVNWLVQSGELLPIPSVDIENTPIVLSEGERQFLFLTMVIFVPTFVGLIGLGYSLARRERQ